MPRVLIPSDNRDFVAMLAKTYRARGWDVVVGAFNFDLAAGAFDLVHLQWPEELTGWQPPDDRRIGEIAAGLEAWGARARLLLTVHNLFPHRHHGNAAYRRLLNAVYERVPVLAHFTAASREMVGAEFPAAAAQKNVVTGFFNANELRPAVHDRAGARRRLGLAEDEFVLLVFGTLREWTEVELLRAAFDAARVPRRRLLMAGRYNEFGPVWRQRWRRWSFARWRRGGRVVVEADFIPEADVHRVADAADAVLIPRLHALNSGLPALAASFGLSFIAPDTAPFRELAAGTQNPLYTPGDAPDLARAIERAAALDRAAVVRENRALAETWSWEKIVTTGLQATGFE